MAELGTETKTLVHYRVEGSLDIFELDDPPAKTDSHETRQRLDQDSATSGGGCGPGAYNLIFRWSDRR
jgi:hypothetical protein